MRRTLSVASSLLALAFVASSSNITSAAPAPATPPAKPPASSGTVAKAAPLIGAHGFDVTAAKRREEAADAHRVRMLGYHH